MSLRTILVLALLVGCAPNPAPPACSEVPTDACPLPSYVPPGEVDDWDEFLATASTLMCIAGLREGLGDVSVVSSWCHPAFAALYLQRTGVELPLFPLDAARACLVRLETSVDPVTDGFRCLALTECAGALECCAIGELGDACSGALPCRADLECTAGICASPPTCGDACPLGACRDGECECPEGCPDGQVCDAFGACVGASPGGTTCGCDAECRSGECVEGRCAGVRPIGCGCTLDEDCPADVSTCVSGVCVLRPMLGEPCIEGAPCFGSACVDGTCSRIPEGQRGCDAPDECASGLVCAPLPCRGFVCDRICVAPTTEGGPCAAEDVCLDGLTCRSGRCERVLEGAACREGCGPDQACVDDVCVALAGRGEPCVSNASCRAPYVCNGTVCEGTDVGDPCPSSGSCPGELICMASLCVARPVAGEACSPALPCAAGHACREDVCRVLAEVGEPCIEVGCVPSADCEAGICARPAQLGEACGTLRCQGDALCVDGACVAPTCA